MKNVFRKMFLAALLAGVLTVPAWAQTRIATVDLGKLFEKYWKTEQATAALQITGNTSLSTIAGKDFATQTTLAAILAKIIAAPATEAKQDTGNTALASILAKLSADPATQTTLAAILTAIGSLAGKTDTQPRANA